MVKIGDFQFNLFFSIFYFLLITPVGLITNLFNDFLSLKSSPKWEEVGQGFSDIGDLREQS